MYSCLILGHNLKRATIFLELLKKANRDKVVVNTQTNFVTYDQHIFVAYGISKPEDLIFIRGRRVDYVFIDDDLKYVDYYHDVRVGALCATHSHSVGNFMYFDLDKLIKGGLI
ncbi:MAG TPA: hypothetical protein VK190_02860 [Pseudoneobacillus sp.]|nr:hypothetical protein [Pseudoneobacillus sp.]